MIYLYIIIALIGIGVGALTGITGSSGVLIVVPALSIMGLGFKTAVGSSLLVDVITTTIVIYVYFKDKTLDIYTGLFMGVGAVIGAQIGTYIASMIDAFPLELAFIFMTGYMSYYSMKRSFKKTNIAKRNIERKKALPVAMLLSIPIGILTGTIGTSGGVMFVFITMLLFNISAQKMVGTATLAMLFSALSGVGGYIRIGHIDFLYSIIIGGIALISGYYFSVFAHRIDEKYIYRSLSFIFMAVIITESIKIV
ncbi:sulfite exporter TauE/SafE family protein [Picrophilus oshimae]|uniref:Probable membrane transporter protein n=1 Tax=Picrophilus torridus (strain ATCC 700027 / DSM 9790 / JCM 10055 / NBRC 100828 / KAW 2/3) TaxID=1122961 RepID=Q6L1P5_PICTO|nr:sulfite exporter TauE/SafE family protein [Picrophilus oshimae]AAT43107.1 transporter [Picrophilus oshimae DSM 9789]SMD30585.1 hypothetical protein SAMN02745355_0474 [Picrophilus oshimae DSM 9789]